MFGEDKSVPNNNRHPYKIEINEVQDYNNDGATDLVDVEYLLKNDKNSLTLLSDFVIWNIKNLRIKLHKNLKEEIYFLLVLKKSEILVFLLK